MNDIIKVNLKPEAPVKVNAEAIVIVNPDKIELQDKSVKITENGTQTITPDEGVGGLTAVEVTVDIQPKLQSKSATENGTVAPDEGFDGLGEVIVDVKPNLQDKRITENGEYTADEGYDGLGKVEVNVISDPSSDPLRKLLSHELSGSIVYNDVTNALESNIFANQQNLESVSLPKVTAINSYCFYNCQNLVSVDVSKIKTAPMSAFYQCSKLSQLKIGNLTSIDSYSFCNTESLVVDFAAHYISTISTYAFKNSGIKSFRADKLGGINVSTFEGCPNLTLIDIGRTSNVVGPVIRANACNGAKSLTTLILGKGNNNVHFSLASTNALEGTPIAEGTGYIYVPDDYVEDYKAATNWSTFADQIKPLSELPTE